MEAKIIYLFAVLAVLSVGISLVQGEVDCDKRPPHADIRKCCPMPSLISEEIIEKCKQSNEVTPTPPSDEEEETSEGGHKHHNHHHHHHHHHHHPHHHHCFASCVLNETGVMVDGEFDADALGNYLSEALNDAPDMIPIVKGAFEECYDKAEETMEKIRIHYEKNQKASEEHGHHDHHHGHAGHHGHHGHCSPKSGIIMGCAMMKTFKQCPDSIWSDSDECNALRDFMTECKPPHEKNE